MYSTGCTVRIDCWSPIRTDRVSRPTHMNGLTQSWLAEYREGDVRLLYDSFGHLPSAQWQPRLQGVETTDPDPEQPPVNPDGSKTEWCGQACLAFGLVCKAYGYNIARAVLETAKSSIGSIASDGT